MSPCISDGDFATGDASEDMYDPSPILDDEDGSGGSASGVVVVTVAFRVGPFGFLSLGSDAVPGNMVKLVFVDDDRANFLNGRCKSHPISH